MNAAALTDPADPFPTTLELGTHVITFAAVDRAGETDADLEAIQHGGVTGGSDGDTQCLVHVFIANLIAFANIGLTGFLVSSLSARFVFPSIGSEGSAIGLTLTSPLSLKQYMLYKYLFYVMPFTVLATILLIASNHLLRITGPMWWISVTTGLIITWTVVS